MAKRSRIPAKKSQRLFSRTAKKTNKKNLTRGTPMRGGIRM